MQRLEVSGAVRHLYIYVIRRLKVKIMCVITEQCVILLSYVPVAGAKHLLYSQNIFNFSFDYKANPIFQWIWTQFSTPTQMWPLHMSVWNNSVLVEQVRYLWLVLLNHLNHTGDCTYKLLHQLKRNRTNISTYSINLLYFIMDTQCVHCQKEIK
jgi:hypothetical protein